MTWNKDSARDYLFNYLRGKLKAPELLNVDRFGHALLKAGDEFFYFLFKKDRIHSFNYLFPDYIITPNAVTGLGESINVEYLTYAMKYNATLVFAYEDMEQALYTPSKAKLKGLLAAAFPEGVFDLLPAAALLKIFCDYHKLKRTQDRQNTYKANDYTDGVVVVNEATYCFPFPIMERLKV